MPRTFTLVSVSIHAVVLTGVYVAQTLSSGPLPMLRDTVPVEDYVRARFADVPLPKLATRPEPSEGSVAAAAAPLDAPSTVTLETGRENEPVTVRSSGPVAGVEQRIDISAPMSMIPDAAASPPAAMLQAPIHLHSGIQPPRKIQDVKPVYPALAQTTRLEGVVILETIIDVSGRVETVHVLRGYQLLDQAAIDAVKQWRFTPALLNGEPVPVVMTVTVNFSLK